MSENSNGRFKDFFSKNWGKMVTGLIAIISAFIGLKITVMNQGEAIAKVIPKVEILERYHDVHENEHKHLVTTLERIENKIDRWGRR